MSHIFSIFVEGAQDVALRKIGRKLSDYELYRVGKGMRSAFEMWEEVLTHAIKEVVSENKKY